jgi:tRNA (guanine37-N1)-methyltransferase
MFFEIVTLFPQMFTSVFADSIIARAIDKKLVSIHIDNIRNYTGDRHCTVDDYPYGGDPGMVLKAEPVAKAIRAARERRSDMSPGVILLSPRGKAFNHETANELSKQQCLILLCGRYKGIDQRVVQKYVDMEISIGDFVLSGGELAAMVLVDTITRLVPGVLGNEDSAGDDSFFGGLLSPPSYTRPEIFEDEAVPPVLLSGNHRLIAQWKQKQAQQVTRERRPDLWEKYCRENKEKK